MNSELKLALDRASLRYLEVRAKYANTKIAGENLSEVETERTLAHNGLLASFSAFYRNANSDEREGLPRPDADRVTIGRWSLRRAFELLNA